MDRVLRNLLVMFLVGVAMIVVAQVGERLGWWNDFGLWATGAGLVLSILSVALAIVYSSSKPQVATIALSVQAGTNMMAENNRMLGDNNRMLGDNNRMLGDNNRMLGEMKREHGEKLDRVVDILRDIRDRL